MGYATATERQGLSWGKQGIDGMSQGGRKLRAGEVGKELGEKVWGGKRAWEGAGEGSKGRNWERERGGKV